MSIYNDFKFLIKSNYNQFLVKLQAAHFLDVLERRQDDFLKNFRKQLESRLDYYEVDSIPMFKILESSSELVSDDNEDISRVPEKVVTNIAFRNIFVLDENKDKTDNNYVKIKEFETYKLPKLPEGQAYFIRNDNFEDYSPCVEITYRNDYGDDMPSIRPITTNGQYYNYPVNKYANNVLDLIKGAVSGLSLFHKNPSVYEVTDDEVGERQFGGTANMFLDKIRSLVVVVVINYLKNNVKNVRKFVSKDIVNKFNLFENNNSELINNIRNMFKRKYSEALQIKSDGKYASIFNSFLHLITAEDHKFTPQQIEQINQEITDIGVKDKNLIRTILQTYVSGDITDGDIAKFMKEQTFTEDTENLNPDVDLKPEQKKKIREFYQMFEDSDFGDIVSNMNNNFAQVNEALAKIRDIRYEIKNHYDKIMDKASDLGEPENERKIRKQLKDLKETNNEDKKKELFKYLTDLQKSRKELEEKKLKEDTQEAINKFKENKSSVSTRLKIVTSGEKVDYPRELSDEEIVIEIYNNTVNNVPLNLSSLDNLNDIRSLDLDAMLTPFFNSILENLKTYDVNKIFRNKKRYENETGKHYVPSLNRSIKQDEDFIDIINNLLNEKLPEKDIYKDLDDFLTDDSLNRDPDNIINISVFKVLEDLRSKLQLNNSKMSENIKSDFDELLDLCRSSRFTITGIDYIIAYLIQLASIFQVYADMYDNDSSSKSINSNKAESVAGRIGAIYNDLFLPLSNYRNLIYNTDELSRYDLSRFHPTIELDDVDIFADTYSDLKNYPIENINDGDIAKVKRDENNKIKTESKELKGHDGLLSKNNDNYYYPTTFYKWTVNNGKGQWNLIKDDNNLDIDINEDTEENRMSGDTMLESQEIKYNEKNTENNNEDDTNYIINKYKDNPELQNILDLYNSMKSTSDKLQEDESDKSLDNIQDVRNDVRYTVKNKNVKKDNVTDVQLNDDAVKIDNLLKKYKIKTKRNK